MLLLSPDFLVPAINVPFPGTSPLNKPSTMTNIIECSVLYLAQYVGYNQCQVHVLEQHTAQYWLDWQFAVAQVFIDR